MSLSIYYVCMYVCIYVYKYYKLFVILNIQIILCKMIGIIIFLRSPAARKHVHLVYLSARSTRPGNSIFLLKMQNVTNKFYIMFEYL